MPDLSEVQLETARLYLRPYTKEDAGAVYEVISKKDISDMTMRIPYPCPKDYALHWIEWGMMGRKQGISCEFGIFKKNDGNYVGNCGMADILYRNKQASVAYFISPDRWGNGFATEALEVVCEFGFEVLGLEKIGGRCFEDNVASRRVMEKIGMKLEGILRNEIYKDGAFRNVCVLSILKDEWGKL